MTITYNLFFADRSSLLIRKLQYELPRKPFVAEDPEQCRCIELYNRIVKSLTMIYYSSWMMFIESTNRLYSYFGPSLAIIPRIVPNTPA